MLVVSRPLIHEVVGPHIQLGGPSLWSRTLVAGPHITVMVGPRISMAVGRRIQFVGTQIMVVDEQLTRVRSIIVSYSIYEKMG